MDLNNLNVNTDELVAKIKREMYPEEENSKPKGPETLQQLEFRIQNSRITQIFEKLIKNVKLIFCLPEMLKNDELLSRYFEPKEKNEIVQFCEILQSDSDETLEQILEGGMSKKAIKTASTLEKILKSGLYDEVEPYLKTIPVNCSDFLGQLLQLKSLAERRIQTDAPKEMAKEKVLHDIYIANKKNKEKIEALKEKIESHDTRCREIFSEKYATIERFENEIVVLQEHSKDEISRCILESDKKMIKYCKDSDARQHTLSEDAEQAQENYNRTLEENLRNEKLLREQKSKITQQLQQWIAKYDVDVGIRTKELEKLTEKYEQERGIFTEWHEGLFLPQENNYLTLMNEKEEEEQRMHEEKILMFMMNRSARILQTYWRALILRRKSRKGRKGRRRK